MNEPMDWRTQRNSARQIRMTVTLAVIAFGVTLALVVGNRMNQTALSVVVGVAAGVVASIPTTLILLLLLRSRQNAAQVESPFMQMMPRQRMQAPVRQGSMMTMTGANGMVYPQPPVIVVAPAGHLDPRASFQPAPVYANQMPTLTPAPREFQMIGEPGYFLDDGF